MKAIEKIDDYLGEAMIKVGDYYIPTYGLTGRLRQIHLEYFKSIIEQYGTPLQKTDDVFQLKKAWVEAMKVISDEKHHKMITKAW